MGTRHLTVVRLGGKYKIAQYGQRDGYQEGQGITVLEFVHKLKNGCLEHFKNNLQKCRWITDDERKELEYKVNYGLLKNWKKVYPQFHRDTGAEILDFVLKSTSEIVLADSFDFAFDHTWCEYIWCIDLDNNVFGLYVGDDENKALYPAQTWKIDEAPTKEEFLDAFKEKEDTQ